MITEIPEYDCGDGGCELTSNRGGMRTNGGCHCLQGLDFEKRKIVALQLRALRKELKRLTIENSKLKENK